ncbi:L,D-transpeptidase family protein [Dysgonomonas reticulitermitis]
MKYTLYTILIVIMIFFTSCKERSSTKLSESSKKEVILSKFAKNYPDFNPQHLKEVLQSRIQEDSILQNLYVKNTFTPIWIHDTLDIQKIKELTNILENSYKHGLSVDYFPTGYIKSLMDSIDSGAYSLNLDILYQKMADLEFISTNSAIKYITGMNYGFTNPEILYKKDYDIYTARPDSIFFDNLYINLPKDPINLISGSHPDDLVYRKLLDEYQDLDDKKDLKFDKIESPKTYKIGDKNPYISDIARRLIITGEYKPDSTSTDTLHQILNKDLLAAINTFRRKNSYPEEDEVGKITIDALNKPLEYYQSKLRANMERYRWKRTKPKHDKHIEVNIAPAMLFACQKDSLPLIMRVCVGSVTNKTPLLESDISYLNLNPIWNVPTSIAQKEVAVLQKKDSTYIKRNNMKLYKGGKEVDLESINWKEVNPSKFAYTIRQNSGERNALGLIKFIFNNAFSVYLHDTPSKAAFNRKNRAVSHGCVRVQKPFDLAFFCMSATSDDIYKDRLYYSVGKSPVSNEGKKLAKENKLKKLTDILNPESKISLFVDYYTAYMYPDDNDTLYYADDIYDYDNIILNALDNKEIKRDGKTAKPV